VYHFRYQDYWLTKPWQDETFGAGVVEQEQQSFEPPST
jgi:hypothetical protein